MDVTDLTFEQDVVEESRNVPVVVDFWADWCGPCHALAPVLEAAIAERATEVTLAKIDVDASPGLAQRFGVSGIPAVKAFRDGRVVKEFVGALSPTAVSTWLDELLAAPNVDDLLDQLRASGEAPDVVAALEAGDVGQALGLIVAAVAGAGPDERERLRELAVSLFEVVGHDDPLVSEYRRRLATALY